MTRNSIWIASTVVALMTSVAWASPLKVNTLGAKSQEVKMCPDCKAKITCATVGDYSIGFDANLENAKTGAATITVHVLDKAKNPVKDAKVIATLTMPNHQHGTKAPLTLKQTDHGRYAAGTQVTMPGAWQTNVEVTPAGGDTVKQVFVFTR